MSVLIAALGSAHGADSLGWEVADFIERHLSGGCVLLPGGAFEIKAGELRIKKYLHPTAMLADLASHSHVFFIDACRSSEHSYGELLSFSAHELQPGAGVLSSHGAGLSDAVCLAKTLGVLPLDCHVLGLNVYGQEATAVDEGLQQRLIRAVWEEVSAVLTQSYLPPTV
ncbi:hypothetical protein [Teredinibacter haidensis]|uniref:hypothetical protein n=1 Tax=Teredinibacter haidensis TaxID=2731755 RepID=UPI000948E271|nr:hypothetical protein [Teredinibacter haidensis]